MLKIKQKLLEHLKAGSQQAQNLFEHLKAGSQQAHNLQEHCKWIVFVWTVIANTFLIYKNLWLWELILKLAAQKLVISSDV